MLSQALHHTKEPEQAIRSGHRILRPGGRIIVLDLLRHEFAEARTLYGDHWLGFDESELQTWLELASFSSIDVSRVAKETDPPHFQTLLASGTKD